MLVDCDHRVQQKVEIGTRQDMVCILTTCIFGSRPDLIILCDLEFYIQKKTNGL